MGETDELRLGEARFDLPTMLRELEAEGKGPGHDNLGQAEIDALVRSRRKQDKA